MEKIKETFMLITELIVYVCVNIYDNIKGKYEKTK